MYSLSSTARTHTHTRVCDRLVSETLKSNTMAALLLQSSVVFRMHRITVTVVHLNHIYYLYVVRSTHSNHKLL